MSCMPHKKKATQSFSKKVKYFIAYMRIEVEVWRQTYFFVKELWQESRDAWGDNWRWQLSDFSSRMNYWFAEGKEDIYYYILNKRIRASFRKKDDLLSFLNRFF